MAITRSITYLGKNNNIPSEDTPGKGNCAFNAFILAIATPGIVENLENPGNADFVESAAAALGIKDPNPTWDDVKNGLLELRKMANDEKKGLLELQKMTKRDSVINELAKSMRQLSIFKASNDEDYKNEITNVLLPAAFEDYIKDQLNMVIRGHVPDDILMRDEYVQSQFRLIYEKYKDDLIKFKKDGSKKALEDLDNKIETAKKELNSDKIFSEFCKRMSNEGEWAGHPELKILAKCFGVTLDIIKIEGTSEYLLPLVEDDNNKNKIYLINDNYTHWSNCPSDLIKDTIGELKEALEHATKVTIEIKKKGEALQKQIADYLEKFEHIYDTSVKTLNETPLAANTVEQSAIRAKEFDELNDIYQSGIMAFNELSAFILQDIIDDKFNEKKYAEYVSLFNKLQKNEEKKLLTFKPKTLSSNTSATSKKNEVTFVGKPKPYSTERPTQFLSDDIIVKIEKKFESTKWALDKVTDITNGYRTATNNEGKTFNIYPNKLTTNECHLETFKMMLEIFKTAHDVPNYPKITTDKDSIKTWTDAFEEVYGKNHNQDLKDIITIKEEAAPSRKLSN